QKQGVVVQGVAKTANGGTQAALSNWNTLANAGAGALVVPGTVATGVTSTANFTFAQSGTIELQGQNTYTGDTLVNVASTLFPTANDGNVNTLAILQVNNSSVTSSGALVSGPIGAGLLHMSGGGIQDGGLPVVLNNSVTIDPKTTTYTFT